jgi:hypothetical protein
MPGHITDSESERIREFFSEAIRNGIYVPSVIKEFIEDRGQSVSLVTVEKLLHNMNYAPTKAWQKEDE